MVMIGMVMKMGMMSIVVVVVIVSNMMMIVVLIFMDVAMSFSDLSPEMVSVKQGV
jgi:hypothetical protein